jgi:dCMP deaminase
VTKQEKYLAWAESGAKIFSTCAKAQYMALVVDRYGIVVATGYNGVPSGFKHCKDGGCPRAETVEQGGSYDNCSALHAEANALLRVSRESCEGATIYVSGLPCWDCAKLIVGSGIKRVVYRMGRKPVDLSKVLFFFEDAGVELVGRWLLR